MGIRAEVVNGRIVVDEPTDLPDGTVLELVLDDDGDSLDTVERGRLHDSIDAGVADVAAGNVAPAAEVINELLASKE